MAMILALTLAAYGQDPCEASKPSGGANMLVVSYPDGAGVLQLFTVREDGAERRQITRCALDCTMPSWSPDGRRIAYVSRHPAGHELWSVGPEGEMPKQLFTGGTNLLPGWLPDSRHLVWMKTGRGTSLIDRSELWIMDAETLNARPLFPGARDRSYGDAMPTLSPDGKSVAFVSDRDGIARIWVSRLDGSEARQLAPIGAAFDKAIGAPLEQKVPAWSPDGREVAYWQGVEMSHMSRFTGIQDAGRDALIQASWHVWVAPVEEGEPRQAGQGDDPTWSPQGFLTRSFPDPGVGGPNIMIASRTGWVRLPALPPGARRYGRFAWRP